ncbi:MAG: hypothetical protein WCZ13_01150 [Acholeplasmataceae bacterium]
MIELGNKILGIIDWIVPSVLVILAIFITASVLKGYKRVIKDAKEITSSFKGVLFFIVIVVVLLFCWFYIRSYLKI